MEGHRQAGIDVCQSWKKLQWHGSVHCAKAMASIAHGTATAGNDWGYLFMGHATSPDGYDWTRRDDEVGIVCDPETWEGSK